MKPERQVLHDLVLPPNAITSEQSLIGGLLLDNMAWDKIADIVAEVDFYRDDHRRIFRHIAKLIEVGRPADVVTVYESLEKSNESEQAGGLAYLGEIANNTPSAANIRGYAEVVAIRSREREALAAAEQFRSDILGKGSLQDAATRLGNAVQSIAERSKSIRDFDEVDVSAFLATQPAPIDWLAEERIQLGRGGLLVGIGGSSKTRTLYHLAIGAIVGRLPWDWSITQTGSAALVLAEDTGEDVHRTLAATLNAIGATRAERELVERNLHVLALAGKECRLIDVHDGVAKENARHAELLRKLRGYTDLVFVGLDPALAFTAGDELDQAHQRALGRMADSLAVQTGAAVLMTAHSAKGNQNTDELASHSARGGGAITDAVRAEYSLRTMTAAEATKAGITDLEERKRHVQLVATKGNHLPPSAFVPVWLRRGEHGSLYAADVCLDRSNLPKVSDADRRAHGVLVEMSETKAPQLEEWRAECVRIGVVKATAGAAQEKAMQRILDRLLAAGLIKKGTGRGAYLPATQGDEQ